MNICPECEKPYKGSMYKSNYRGVYYHPVCLKNKLERESNG